MKCFLLLSILWIVCCRDSALATNSMIASFAKTCQTQENASDKDVENLSNGIAPETAEGKCLAACLGKQYSVIQENKLSKTGFINVVGIVNNGDADKKKTAVVIADTCIDVTDEERCESAFKIWNCIEEQLVKLDTKLF